METQTVFVKCYRRSTFKSYYVVWKLHSMHWPRSRSPTFKSYYVVWKHTERVEISACRCEFKSYYVVWKLVYTHGRFCVFHRLNRTMQYGNFYYFFDFLFFFWFKSYYVVWKPDFVHDINFFFFCLNRTMQYGNQTRWNGISRRFHV